SSEHCAERSSNSASDADVRSTQFRQRLNRLLAEIRQIRWAPAGDVVAVDDYRLAGPDCAGVDQIVLDARRAGPLPALADSGRDADLRAVADGGDKLARLVELPHEREHLRVAADGVGHPAADEDDAVEVLGSHIGDGGVADGRIAVLAFVGCAGGRAGEGDGCAGLDE